MNTGGDQRIKSFILSGGKALGSLASTRFLYINFLENYALILKHKISLNKADRTNLK